LDLPHLASDLSSDEASDCSNAAGRPCAAACTNTHVAMSGVVVVGSANVDLVTNAPRMPSPGETLLGTRFEQLFGGKGANQAVAAALLGSSVTMVAKLGEDSLGEASMANFKTLGVDASFISTTSDAASGVAQITVDSSGQNEIVIVAGANGLLSSEDVDAAAPAFERSSVLLTQLEVPLPTTIAALRAGRKAGLMTVFNSAPAPTEPLPDELYPLCDIICPNETETALLTGMPTNTLKECEAAARAIIAKVSAAVPALAQRLHWLSACAPLCSLPGLLSPAGSAATAH
jgi:ribokinase